MAPCRWLREKAFNWFLSQRKLRNQSNSSHTKNTLNNESMIKWRRLSDLQSICTRKKKKAILWSVSINGLFSVNWKWWKQKENTLSSDINEDLFHLSKKTCSCMCVNEFVRTLLLEFNYFPVPSFCTIHSSRWISKKWCM